MFCFFMRLLVLVCSLFHRRACRLGSQTINRFFNYLRDIPEAGSRGRARTYNPSVNPGPLRNLRTDEPNVKWNWPGIWPGLLEFRHHKTYIFLDTIRHFPAGSYLISYRYNAVNKNILRSPFSIALPIWTILALPSFVRTTELAHRTSLHVTGPPSVAPRRTKRFKRTCTVLLTKQIAITTVSRPTAKYLRVRSMNASHTRGSFACL